MTDTADLERGYRRWLRWYPKAFRREHEAEILAVLLAGARAGQRQPAPMECLDLLRSALRMRCVQGCLGRTEQSSPAIKLMYLRRRVESPLRSRFGHHRRRAVERRRQASGSHRGRVASNRRRSACTARGGGRDRGRVLAVDGLAVGRGHRWARTAFAGFFASTVGLLRGLLQGSAVYARPDLAIGSVLVSGLVEHLPPSPSSGPH